ncbi:tgacg-sequence-specific DNA-binding protein tga-1b [Phtheirospermum japonicum]|uniref:Tgacg-sequence-specific DNA-binding protein tga-1b n=1 Tax=Phtheirospermum japonicum TaxID=374723 RepID=A0A830BJW9_9LAMI|nr:tgacg-sequence-specific DNA-binding protein tga-1b [Phtheirospermum japonicum]
MPDPTVVTVDPPPPPLPPKMYLTGEFDPGLSIPPLDTTFFSEHFLNGHGTPGDDRNDVALGDIDFDFSFDDLCLPSSDDLDDLLKPTPLQQSDSQSGSDPNLAQFAPNFDQLHAVFKSTYPELRHLPGDGDLTADRSWEGSGVLNSPSPEMESQQISGYLNMPSPESNGSNRDSSDNCGGDVKVQNCHSPKSQGSGNFGSNLSGDSNNRATRSVSSSPNSSNSSIRTGVVDQKIKLEEPASNNSNKTVLKRKKEVEDVVGNNNDNNVESRINKYRKSDCSPENNNSSSDNNGVSTEEEEKRKTRLLRNRESAQLSRQRKKHYVEELEDKVRTMHSTIQDLNSKISFFMAENATLRQQMSGGGGGAVPPPPMAQPPPGMYPHPAMMYPWMPCPPPYMVKPQGSQVPLVPIPRLKTQKSTQAPKTNKKTDSKKNEGPKTKKVASVSFLGLLFFIMLFGGLVPMVNVRYGGVREAFTGGEGYPGGGFSEKHRGRVLMVNGTEYSDKHGGFRDSSSNCSVHCGQNGPDPSADEFVLSGNGSEPLAASLYVPRNDKLVKIDGNLIIHSVLASEKAMASHGKRSVGETGLIVPGDLVPAIPVSGVGRNGAAHPHLRALGSGSADKDSVKSTTTDGKLQQWFREGLAGPMLSAGLCTEVFQFDVSAPGAIIPSTTIRNISEEQAQNSTHPSMGRNRRILHPIPLPESSHNISREQHAGRNSEKENLNGNKNTSSMVVSVLFDPREAGDADVDGVMGTKSLSRIFVVVLIDSVKYVTYSCMLPFTGSATHLVTG